MIHPTRLLVALVTLLALALPAIDPSPAQAQGSTPPPSPIVPGEVLVKFQPGTPGQAVADAHRQAGGQVRATIPQIEVQVVGVPPGLEVAAAAAYERNPNVRYSEANRLYQASSHGTGYPNDPRFEQQWQYRNSSDKDIDAFEAWTNTGGTKGSSTVKLAILDTGIGLQHSDLSVDPNLSRNFTRSSTLDDRYGHGTHVAGSAAAKTGNETGVAGTCPGCTLMNVKVLGDNGSGQWDWIANGIIWAADQGADVISMSLGGYSESQTLRDAVVYAWGQGAVLTAAAGNDGQNWGSYPAVYEQVIAVGATDQNDNRASFSNWGGNWIDVAAPGQDILSTAPVAGTRLWSGGTDGYATLSGTSMATPHVAGVAGLVWSSACSGRNNQCVRDQIENTAEDTSGTGETWNDFTRYGRINAQQAVGAGSQSAAPTLPSLSINDVAVTEGNSGTTTATFTVSLSAAAPTGGVTFDIATAAGTTTPATAGSDYVEKSLMGQTIPAGTQTSTFEVTVNGDADVESNETFLVNVTNVSGATVADGQGLGTITNDDAAATPSTPSLAINDVSVTEGNSGTTTATFTVTLSAPAPTGGVTVNYATANQTATAGSDYVAKSGSLTFAQNETSKNLTITINGDTAREQNETFVVNLTNATNATIGDAQGVGTIRNDDRGPGGSGQRESRSTDETSTSTTSTEAQSTEESDKQEPAREPKPR